MHGVQWQDAAVEEVLNSTLVTLHGVQPSPVEAEGAVLGPTLTTTVLVEGTPAEALLDTGSPVTIISLEFLVKPLARGKKNCEQMAIREEVKSHLKPTTLKLKSYSGEDLPIVKQARVPISCGRYTITARVQVQMNAPVEVLLGTDLQPSLGFRLFDLDDPSQALDGSKQAQQVLTGDSKSMDQLTTEEDPALDTPAKVCLLQAVRVPARHSKLVQAKIGERFFPQGTAIAFQPEDRLQELTGLVVEEAVIPAREEVALVISNPGMCPIRLQEGQLLGEAQAVYWVRDFAEADDKSTNENRVCSVIDACQPQKLTECQESLLKMLHTEGQGFGAEGKEQLQNLVLEFEEAFALDETELGCAQDVTHTIDTADHKPVRQMPRLVPFALRGEVEQMVEKMLQQGVIKPSQSPWASPIILVAKKDGSTRFCVDYRKLNAITKMDVYPLPRIDDTLDLLANNQYFTTLDLASGYWQVKMDNASREKTAFTTHVGLYEFTVMPFGLCNAPATFQRLMESVLHGLLAKCCLVYLDDVLVLGKTV